MSDRIKNLMIGIFISTALAVITLMILFLHPYVGDEGVKLHVRFVDIDKVTVGTRVLFAGKPVGEVLEINELPDVRTGRKGRLGDIYVYELVLAVDSSVKVYNSDKISLRTSGLLGEKSVAIDPEPPLPGQKLRVINHEVIYADGTTSVEDTFKDIKKLSQKFESTLDQFNNALTELKDMGFWENLGKTAENIADFTSNLEESWPDIESTLANANEISTSIRDGQGTLGKLITGDELYLRTTSLLSKGETVLDDMNHYGILFHLDKGWQRLRARRMNLLQKLRTPQEFRNFFNDEIAQISTSLSRVNLVVEKSCEYPVFPELAASCEYQKVFAELLRRVEALDEALKMYNTQVVDPLVHKTELY